MDGYLVPSPRYGFRFEAASRLWDLNLTLSVYVRNATLRYNLSLVSLFLWMIVELGTKMALVKKSASKILYTESADAQRI